MSTQSKTGECCLVTGASGYIGRALSAALLAEGCEVRAQWHSRNATVPGASALQVDLTQGLDAHALGGIEVVYHLAALAHSRAEEVAYRAVNVDATERLYRAAAAAGVARFIYLSSTKAALAERGDPAADAYARSKWDAERALRRIAGEGGPALLIVRPALVYGGEERGHLGWLRRWVDLHLSRPPTGGERAMIARADLVRILLRLRTAPLATPQTLTLGDGERYSARRLHAALCAARGKRPWLPPLPRPLWRLLARAADVFTGAPPGATWYRLQGREVIALSDTATLLGVAPALRFEDVIAAEGAEC